MKLSLTKKYFNKFRVGQIVKIINLPYLYYIPYGGSKQPTKLKNIYQREKSVIYYLGT